MSLAHNAIDRTGQTFHYWTVGRYMFTKKKGRHHECTCKCGTVSIKDVRSLTRGRSLSCGCYSIERHTKHGKRKTRVYNIWRNVKHRTTNQNATQWKWYGGRGITMSDVWLNDFDRFYADMGDPPTPKHSIDRINNDGNYEPGNCRWATMKQQSNNRRKTQPLPAAPPSVDGDQSVK